VHGAVPIEQPRSTAAQLDKVGISPYFLDGGRVLESGPPARLFTEPTEERTRQFLRRIIDAGRL